VVWTMILFGPTPPPHTHTPCVVRTKWASACGYVGFVFVFVFFWGGEVAGILCACVVFCMLVCFFEWVCVCN
jgi:hypothetical protein